MDSKAIRARAQEYVEQEQNESFRSEVEALLKQNNDDELFERFYTDLSFGTGGIRGVMGGGFNRMNPLVIQRTTQGLANYLLEHGIKDQQGRLSVAIAYDSRNNSPLFSSTAAQVLAANGIHVYLFSSLRPTPELSFTIRELGCTSGIVCTASHNPKKYNGYKVYWQDGAQITPPHDAGIISQVKAVNGPVKSMDFQEALDKGLVEYIDADMDNKFVEMVKRQVVRPDMLMKGPHDLKVVYTPLHGTGTMMIERVMNELGISVSIVPEQRDPDGDFPTVEFPNPEEASAMKLALDLARKEDADLVIGTDPDADRVGIAVKSGNDYVLLNGNQHGVLLTDYMYGSMKELGTLPQRPAFINTIVSTDLQRKIAAKYGAEVFETLTGFKWIASKIRELEENNGPRYVMGGEESYGFMIGNEVRDKDSISATVVTIEMALYYQQKGKSLLDRLDEIHGEFGLYQETLISKYFEGANGVGIMNGMMAGLRENPPAEIAGIAVSSVRDIQDGTTLDIQTGSKKKDIDLPSSNVLQFILSDGSIISARPSGTEPKIKFYASVKDEPGKDLDESRKRVQEKIDGIESFIESVIAAAKN
ncbi:phospho-sugar mutase [Salinispira pacifica]|uniref:Phosphoglucomutase n=1 Tax=Salinispira pacifica TaxID=1307761 RepID=V5WGB9_9SPIO|nr:phospho-sugar mutase [Salinispira pacifica]AHC14665.1 Phosphoglucomutase [Salinispira pacifica]